MNKMYSVTIKAETTYEIKAENADIALDKAIEYWNEHGPDGHTIKVLVEEVIEDD